MGADDPKWLLISSPFYDNSLVEYPPDLAGFMDHAVFKPVVIQ